MINNGKSDSGTKLNIPGTRNYIFLFPESILTGTISVRDGEGNSLWQKEDCTVEDIPFAIEIAKRGINTGIFEC